MSYDVIIAGDGYMVQPGSYQRSQDGAGESRVGRVRVFDFFGGGQRAVQLERDRFWKGIGAWPAFDSQGIVSGPRETQLTESSIGLKPGYRYWSSTWQGITYIAGNDKVWRVDTDGNGDYEQLTLMGTAPAQIVDAAEWQGKWVFAHGTAAFASEFVFADEEIETENWSEIATSYVLKLGRHLDTIVLSNPKGTDDSYRIRIRRPDEVTPNVAFRDIDSGVLAFVEHRGACWFFTHHGLYRLTSSKTDDQVMANYTGEASVPQIGYDDDIAWAISHLGDLWCWLGKEVHRYNASDRVFQPMGLRGRATHGVAAVGKYLVVNIDDQEKGHRQLWAFDGRGWWLLDEERDGLSVYGCPISIHGAARNGDLFAVRGPLENRSSVWQFFERSGSVSYRHDWEITTALLDGGERDLEKVWRKAGAVLAWPDQRSGTGTVDVALDYSINGGETWIEAASDELGASTRTAEISGTIPDAARSRWIQLRIRVSNVDQWSPVLMGMWAEHETLDIPVRRRRWRFTVQCADTLTLRDGGRSPLSARAIADQLWELWETGGVASFRDVDYDRSSEEYTIRIASIREIVSKPSEMSTIAQSEIELGLVEV